jgi:iron(III) transport system permease protein
LSRLVANIVFCVAGLFFGVFFILPILVTVKDAFIVNGEFTFDYLRQTFANPLYREGLFNSFALAVWSTALSLLVAVPLAVVATRFRFPGKAILTSAILIPLILPPFVGAIGVKQMLGVDGSFNALLAGLGLMDSAHPADWLGKGRFWGVAIMNALHLYPILYLNTTAALANLDPAMEEAAENLGCPPWRRFFRVTLPLAMPGIFAGATIVFIWSFTELGVPLIFDYNRVTSVQIFDGINDLGGNPFPFALVVVMLGTSVLLYAAGKFIFGRPAYAAEGRASIGSTERPLGTWAGFACVALFAVVTTIAVMPHIGVVLTALSTDWNRSVFPESLTLQHFRDALGHELTVPSIANSLQYATLSTLIDVILGVAIAYVIVRTRIPGRGILDALSMLPLAVPGLVLAFGYVAMTQPGHILSFLTPGGNPIIILVIAYAVRRLPYVVRSAVAGFQQTNRSLEEAAQNLGATPTRALFRITLPLIAANLIAGALLAFSFAMLEVSDSLILAQQQAHYPITKAIYSLLSSLGNGQFLAAALGVWAMIFLGITIIGASMALGRKLGALFRV